MPLLRPPSSSVQVSSNNSWSHCHWDQVIGDLVNLNGTLDHGSSPGSTADQRAETVPDDEVGEGGTWFF